MLAPEEMASIEAYHRRLILRATTEIATVKAAHIGIIEFGILQNGCLILTFDEPLPFQTLRTVEAFAEKYGLKCWFIESVSYTETAVILKGVFH